MAKRTARPTQLDFIAKLSVVVHTLRDNYSLSRLEAEWYTFQNLSIVQTTADPREAASRIFQLWNEKGELEFMRTMKEHYRS